jgi:hypothetical protein
MNGPVNLIVAIYSHVRRSGTFISDENASATAAPATQSTG